MPNPATTDDLNERFFRELTTRERQIGQRWLDDAYNLLTERLPLLEGNVSSGAIKQDTVIRVVCAMVARVFSNPEGKDREAIDDYSYGRSAAFASGVLRVESDELADLTPGRAVNRSVRLLAYGE